MAEKTKTADIAAEPPNPMLAELWARAKDAHLALLKASGTADETIVTAMRIQLRTMALLAGSIPADTMTDVGVKVMFAALVREQLFHGSGYTLGMIEHGLTADMRHLQGPPLTEGV